MMKKLISVSVMVLMLVQLLCINAYAEEQAWNIIYTGEYNTNREDYYAQITSDKSLNGQRSLKVVYPNTPKADTYVTIENTLTEAISAGTYTFSLNYRTKISKANMSVVVGGTELVLLNDSAFEETTTSGDSNETGWKCLSGSITYSGTGTDKVGIRVKGQVNTCFIDDVSLTDAQGNEYISQGGFEVEVNADVDEPIETLVPSKIVAQSSENKAYISWKNPNADTLSGVSLYEIIGGEAVLCSNALSSARDAEVQYVSGELTEGSIHTYKIVCDYTDKASTQVFKSVKIYRSAEHLTSALGAWRTMGAVDGDISYDRLEKRNGTASIAIKSNLESVPSDVYQGIRQTPIVFEANTEYEISFWVKATICQLMQVGIDWDPDIFTTSGEFRNFTTDGEWQNIVLTLAPMETAKNSAQFLILAKGKTEMWVDDFHIRPKNSDGSYGEDIITELGCEPAEEAAVAASVSNITAKADITDIKLSWETPARDCEQITVYQCAGDVWTRIAMLDKSVTELSLDNLVMDKAYKFKICPVNALNMEGEGTEISVSTILPEYIINDPVLTCTSSASAQGIVQGTYKVTCGVKNYTIDAGMPVEMFAGVYDGAKLIKLYSISETVAKSEKTARPRTLTISGIQIPSGGPHSIQLFWLDSRQDKNVLRKSAIFGENQ